VQMREKSVPFAKKVRRCWHSAWLSLSFTLPMYRSIMLKSIIVEDERNTQELLKSYIEEYCEGVEVVAMAMGVQEAIRAIEAHTPDLVFLDIELSDGDGFQVLEHFDAIPFDVIFTTAYNQYAIRAFKFSATDYLLKPLDIEELQAAVQKVHDKRKPTKTDAATPANEEGVQEAIGLDRLHLQTLIQNLHQAQQQRFRKIVLPTTNGFTVVEPHDIVRCEADRNYTYIFLKDGRRVLVSRTIKDYEEMLEGFDFFRIHQSHLINLQYLKNYIRGRGGSVELTDGTMLDVAARKKADFMRRLSLEE
jgi:two-component system LytT family response regulator